MANTRERKVPALVDKPMDFCPGLRRWHCQQIDHGMS